MIPVNEPLLKGNEKKYLNECIDTGWISSEGPFVHRLEEQFAEKVDRKHGVAVCSGTSALELAIVALKIGPGDEVILPTFTIISCIAAIIRAGATPVLVDSEPDTWNMSVDQIASRITRRTKAIMVVHIYGLPAEIDRIYELAEKFGIYIIEDASQMHGQTYNDQPCGSFGNISIFSFYPNKLVTSGEGGMLLMDDEKLEKRCRSLRNLCFQTGNRFIHEELGWNFRMSNLQAAVGLAQLELLEQFVNRKRNMGERYNLLLNDIPGIQLPVAEKKYSKNIYWVYGIVLKEEAPFDAKEVMRRMKEKAVVTRPFFWPLHEQPVFIKKGLFISESYPVAEFIAKRGFYIPSGLTLTEEQQITVATKLAEILS